MSRCHVGASVRVCRDDAPEDAYVGVVTRHVGPRVWLVRNDRGDERKEWRGDIEVQPTLGADSEGK